MITLPERKYFEINGISMSYLESGDGPPFVMIHGLMANAIDFYYQFREFDRKYRCVAPDTRPFGMTDCGEPESVNLEIVTDDLVKFIDFIAPNGGGVILMGHSFGGIICFELLKRIPRKIERLIIVASPVTAGRGRLPRAALGLMRAAAPAVKPIISCKQFIDFYTFYMNIHPANLTGELKELISRRNELIRDTDLAGMMAYFDSVVSRDESSLSNIPRVPCLVVYGSQDPLFGRRDARDIESLIPGARVYSIEKTRHSCFYEKPDEFNRVVSEFIETGS